MEFKQSDISSVTNKLEKFAQELPEQERNVLNWIVARAKAETAISDADLEAASGGLAADEGDSISVTWSR
ncbi:MAG TPA: hypothetical protein VHC97_10320 [Thermoanaerobaculia bacterium]|jgi:hypothetical protein|nr:hypothetical protein [Thermoanaerobaculia bacterium]